MYKLKFEVAKADDPIYQDESITVITRRNPKPTKHLDEYENTPEGIAELEDDVRKEIEWRRKNGIRQRKQNLFI